MDVDLDVHRHHKHDSDDDDDEDGVEDVSGPLKRVVESGDEDVEGAGAAGAGIDVSGSSSRRRRWWCTYKYRPILGMVPIGVREGEDGEGGEDDGNPLEVVLVERPVWDLEQIQELGK